MRESNIIDALASGQVRLAPCRKVHRSRRHWAVLDGLHGYVRRLARQQLISEYLRRQGLTHLGTPRKPKNWKHPQLPARLGAEGARNYMREYMRLRRHSTRRNKIKNP